MNTFSNSLGWTIVCLVAGLIFGFLDKNFFVPYWIVLRYSKDNRPSAQGYPGLVRERSIQWQLVAAAAGALFFSIQFHSAEEDIGIMGIIWLFVVKTFALFVALRWYDVVAPTVALIFSAASKGDAAPAQEAVAKGVDGFSKFRQWLDRMSNLASSLRGEAKEVRGQVASPPPPAAPGPVSGEAAALTPEPPAIVAQEPKPTPEEVIRQFSQGSHLGEKEGEQ